MLATSTRQPTSLEAKVAAVATPKTGGREKDEDEAEWIRRCLRQAMKMMKPLKRKGLSR